MPTSRGALRAKNEDCARMGAQFRRLREERGLALRTLAGRMGITYPCIRRHEAGEMMLRADALLKAAQIMGVEPGLLFVTGGTE